MKAVVFYDVGDIRLENVPEPVDSPIDAYHHFDRHEHGWLKVKLEPATSLVNT